MAERDLKDIVKDKYGKAALRVSAGGDAACCDSAPSRGERDPITSNLYGCGEASELPAEALAASLGCGNPTALAQLNPGDVVLDWVLAVASTCCCRPSASGRPARHMGST